VDARGIHNNDTYSAVLYGKCRLRARLIIKRIFRNAFVECDTAGIDEHYLATKDINLTSHPVSRNSRLVEHNGDALFGDLVEERAFPGIRATY
jgi:hypothetical protein